MRNHSKIMRRHDLIMSYSDQVMEYHDQVPCIYKLGKIMTEYETSRQNHEIL